MNHSRAVASLCRRQILIAVQREMIGTERMAQTIFARWDFDGIAKFHKCRVVGVAALCPQLAFMLAIWF